MVPKGLAAVVLGSIPFQQGIEGGETIKNIVYGVVLFSIVITTILMLFLEKTPLPKLYAWMHSVGLPRFKGSGVHRTREISGDADKLVPNGDKLFGGGLEDRESSEKRDSEKS